MIASTLNTVAKETVRPDKIMQLPFVDKSIEAEVIKIRSEREARELLKELRGY